MGSCLEKQTAGDTKSGSEKSSLAARGKSQNFLDRRPKCLLLLLSELSSRSNTWTREGAYGGGFPSVWDPGHSQTEDVRSDFFSTIL